MAKDFAVKQKPEPAVQSRVPKWVWLFTLGTAGSFIVLLVYLSNMTQSEQMPDISSMTKSLTASLPAPMPVEETLEVEQQVKDAKKALSFYKLLTEQQVKVAPVESTNNKEQDGIRYGWMLQAASFRNKPDSESLRAQLILSGLEKVNVNQVDVTGKGTFYRVMIGPIENRSKMNAVKDMLADANIAPIARKVALSK